MWTVSTRSRGTPLTEMVTGNSGAALTGASAVVTAVDEGLQAPGPRVLTALTLYR